MTPSQQHSAVARLIARLDTWRIRLRDRSAVGTEELVRELGEFQNALRLLDHEADGLIDQLEIEEERGELASDREPMLSPNRDQRPEEVERV